MGDFTQYVILGEPDASGKVSVRRLSDQKVTVCKASWLKPDTRAGAAAETMIARSKVKAIRMDGLEWTTEVQG